MSFLMLVISLETYEREMVTSGLSHIEDLIFLENNLVWFWNCLGVQPTDSSLELYNILSSLRFFFWQLFVPVLEKSA